jgi:8-oxo-dGTP diphosphatase
LRELHEEFGLDLPDNRIIWAQPFPSMHPPGRTGWLLALHLDASEVATISFGDEGRDPQLLEIGVFLSAPDAVAPLQDRVRRLLADQVGNTVPGYHTGKTSLFP